MQELDDPPGPIAPPAGQFPWQRSSQLRSIRSTAFGVTFRSLAPNGTVTRGRDRNRSTSSGRLGIAAAFIGHPVHQLLREDQSLKILVGDLNGLFEHLAEALQLFEDPFPALRPEFRLLEPSGQRQEMTCQSSSPEDRRGHDQTEPWLPGIEVQIEPGIPGHGGGRDCRPVGTRFTTSSQASSFSASSMSGS